MGRGRGGEGVTVSLVSFLALLPPPPPGPIASGLGGSVAREPVSLPALPISPFHRVPPPSGKEEGAGVGGANPGSAKGGRRR